MLESGDAVRCGPLRTAPLPMRRRPPSRVWQILFNGGTKLGALHGIDKVYPAATAYDAASGANPARPLPASLDFLKPYRCSVQVRQKDPPESWGWPPAQRARAGERAPAH